MSLETRRWMRLMVFFDLPVTSPAKKRNYQVFRNFLLKDGYDMLQWSVYARLCNGQDAASKHYRRLLGHLPPEGSVRCMEITEKQFVAMRHLVGAPSPQEKTVNCEQLLLF